MRNAVGTMFAAAVLALASASFADDDIAELTVEADAAAGASDARVLALDAAFADAVTKAVDELASRSQIAAKRADYDKEIIGRARLWIASFTVTREQVVDGRRRLTVDVRIDQHKLGVRLQQLGIVQTLPEGDGAAPPAAPEGDTVALLARALSPSGVRANYGAAATKVPEFDGVKAVLAARGYRLRPTPAAGPAANRDGDIPLSDSAALAFAGDAKADTALIVGVATGEPATIRGALGPFVLATARVRWLQRKSGNPIIDIERRVLLAANAADASERAARTALGDVMGAVTANTVAVRGTTAAPLGVRDVPTVATSDGQVAVVVTRAAPAAVVAALVKALATQSSNKRAELVQLSPAGYVIMVTTTQSISKVAGQVRKVTALDRTISADVKNNVVRAVVSAAPVVAPIVAPVVAPGVAPGATGVPND